MINCYSLLSFRFFCFACLPEKSQHLHFLQMKTLFVFIDFYIVNYYLEFHATWPCGLTVCSPPLAQNGCLHWSSTWRILQVQDLPQQSPAQQTFPKFTRPILSQQENVQGGKSPAGHRNPPGSDSGVWEELQVTEPGSSLELCTERRGSWRLSNKRQVALLKDALS